MDNSIYSLTTTRRGFLVGVGLAGSAAALTIAGCTTDKTANTETPAVGAKPGENGDGQTGENILRVATGFAIKNLIPAKAGYSGNEFAYAELLLRPQPDGNPTDWILEDATSIDDLTWELTLKDGVRFQNGKMLDAAALAKVMTHDLQGSKPIQAVLPGASIEASASNKVLIRTSKPCPAMRNILADEAYFIIFDLDAYLATNDDPDKLLDAKMFTGPYIPTSLTDTGMELVADPEYWGGETPLDGIKISFVDDEGARVKAVLNNEIDICIYPPTQTAEQLTKGTDATFVLAEAAGPSFCFYMNQEKEVFKDARVRKAILRVFDYEQIADEVFKGIFEPSYSFFDPKLPYAIDIWKTDLNEAEDLLTAAGCTKKDDHWYLPSGNELTFPVLTYPQQPDSETIALALQSQFKQFGIRMEITQVPAIMDQLKGNDWVAGLCYISTLSFGGSPISPLIRGYRTGGPRNFGRIADPELDSMIDELEIATDQDRSYELLRQIQQRIGDYGYNGYTGRRRLGVIVGPRAKNYKPPHAFLWLDAKTSLVK